MTPNARARAHENMALLPPGGELDMEIHYSLLALCGASMATAPNDTLDRIRHLELAVRQQVALWQTNAWESYAALEFVQHTIRANMLRKSQN